MGKDHNTVSVQVDGSGIPSKVDNYAQANADEKYLKSEEVADAISERQELVTYYLRNSEEIEAWSDSVFVNPYFE